MSDYHKNAATAANQAAGAMHGFHAKTFTNDVDRLAYVATADDIEQGRIFFQADTKQCWRALSVGQAPTSRFMFDNEPSIVAMRVRYFGDGSDGDFNAGASGNTNQTTEKNYANGSWPVASTATLSQPNTAVAAFPFRFSGTLALANCPVGGVQCNGIAGGNSGGTAGGTAGGTRTLADGTLLGAATTGAAGGAGGTAAGTGGTAGGALPFALGGSGGASAAGGASGGNAGGTGKAGGATTIPRIPRFAPFPDELYAGVASTTGSPRQIQGGAAGGSGSGGGGDGTAGGGGGGSGGGAPVTAIYCRRLDVTGAVASAVQAKGAKGGNAGSPGAGNRGGGSAAAGSGGGVLIIVTEEIIGSAANIFDVSGGDSGTPGTGTGTAAGADGSEGGWGGTVLVYLIGVGLVYSARGTGAGRAGGAHTGTAPGTAGLGEVTRLGW